MPAAGDAVSDPDGRELGTLTSTDSGWFLQKALGMGYLPADLPSGSAVTLRSADGTTLEARTTHGAFYDPDGARVRA